MGNTTSNNNKNYNFLFGEFKTKKNISEFDKIFPILVTGKKLSIKIKILCIKILDEFISIFLINVRENSPKTDESMIFVKKISDFWSKNKENIIKLIQISEDMKYISIPEEESIYIYNLQKMVTNRSHIIIKKIKQNIKNNNIIKSSLTPTLFITVTNNIGICKLEINNYIDNSLNEIIINEKGLNIMANMEKIITWDKNGVYLRDIIYSGERINIKEDQLDCMKGSVHVINNNDLFWISNDGYFVIKEYGSEEIILCRKGISEKHGGKISVLENVFVYNDLRLSIIKYKKKNILINYWVLVKLDGYSISQMYDMRDDFFNTSSSSTDQCTNQNFHHNYSLGNIEVQMKCNCTIGSKSTPDNEGIIRIANLENLAMQKYIMMKSNEIRNSFEFNVPKTFFSVEVVGIEGIIRKYTIDTEKNVLFKYVPRINVDVTTNIDIYDNMKSFDIYLELIGEGIECDDALGKISLLKNGNIIMLNLLKHFVQFNKNILHDNENVELCCGYSMTWMIMRYHMIRINNNIGGQDIKEWLTLMRFFEIYLPKFTGIISKYLYLSNCD
jgi:hypothetical protein